MSDQYLNSTDPGDISNSSDLLNTCGNKTRSNCFLYAEFIGYFYVQSTICIVGFILNVINCIIFCRKKQFEGAAYRFMAVLSVVDAITLLASLPQCFIRCSFLSICTHPAFSVFKKILTHLEVYAGYGIHNLTEAVSAWLTCFLSVERYLAIKYHYIVKAYFSPPNVHKMLGIIFAVGIVVNLPMFFGHTITYRPNCNSSLSARIVVDSTAVTKSPAYPTYTWVRTVLVQFGPLLFLCVVNSLLIHIVRRQSQKRTLKQGSGAASGTPSTVSANSRNEKRARAQRKLTILLMVIIGLFLGGQIPQAFAYKAIFAILYSPKCQDTKCCQPVYRIFRMVVQNICLFSYGANFFVYVSLNRHFRKALIDLCCLPCWSNTRQDGRSNGTYKSVPLTTVTDALKSANAVRNFGDEKAESSNDNSNNNNNNDRSNNDVGLEESEGPGTPQDSEVCLDTGDDVPAIRKSGATAV